MLPCAVPLMLLLGVFHNVRAKVEPGGLCNPTQNLQPDPDNIEQFYECQEQAPAIGEWTRRKCPKELAFSLANQTCVAKAIVQKQQAVCDELGEACADVYMCVAARQQVVVGQQCSWLVGGYQPCTGCTQYYYQCVPTYTNTGSMCGQWQLVSCPANYAYNSQLGVCVLQVIQQQATCVTGQPLCPCYSVSRCPTGYTCSTGNMCCSSGVNYYFTTWWKRK